MTDSPGTDVDDAPTGGIADDWLYGLAVSMGVAPGAGRAFDALTGGAGWGVALDALSPFLWVAGVLGPAFVVWGVLRRRRRRDLAGRHAASAVADGIWDPKSYARARDVPRAFSLRSFVVVASPDRIEVWQGFFPPRRVVSWAAEDVTSLSAGRSSERVAAPTLQVTTTTATTPLLLLSPRWVPVTRMRGRDAVTFATEARRLLADARAGSAPGTDEARPARRTPRP